MENGDSIINKEIENLTIKVNKVPNLEKGLIISLWGAIDSYNAEEFHNTLKKLVKQGYVKLVFSCCNLNYVSSVGIGTFVTILETVKKIDGNIIFSEMQEKVLHIFDIMGFLKFFNFKESLESAVSFFS